MALAAATSDALKEFYTTDYVETLCYADHPLLGMLKKEEDFSGDSYNVPLWISNSQGRSATFSSAQAAEGPGTAKKFKISTAANFGCGYVNDEDILASKNDEGAFFDLYRKALDGTQENLTRDLSLDAFRDGTGVRGIVGSVTANVITLSDINDLVNFEVGMVLVASATATGALLTGPASMIITGITISGTLLIDATVGSLAATNFLFAIGDASVGGTLKKMTGLSAWAPATIASNDSFWGANRSIDQRRMTMQYLDLSGANALSPVETINKMAFQANQVGGGKPDYCFGNPTFGMKLANELGSKQILVQVKANVTEATILYEGIKVATPYGVITFVGDRDCPSTDLYLLEMKDWVIFSRGKMAALNNIDGLEILRSATQPAEECRFHQYGNMGSRAPGHSCRAKIG